MANFVSQSQRYDAAEMEAQIIDMESELKDEIQIKATLDNHVAAKIATAKEFLAKNTAVLDAQLKRLIVLDGQIREAVVSNMELEKQDQEYYDLIVSEPYTEMAQKIADLYSISAELTSFLVQNGRRGRPPIV
jgi:hypothetical protein